MRILLSLILSLAIYSVHAKESQVLAIGDSQSFGSFGPRLQNELNAEGHSTSFYARPGAIADWYLKGTQPPKDYGYWDAPFGGWPVRKSKNAKPTPLLKDLIRQHKPKLVIVQLGGNMHYLKDEEVRRTSQELLSVIGEANASCLWIGPPPGEKRPQPRFDEFYVVLQSVVEASGCRFVDSRQAFVGIPKGGDGIHLDTMKDGLKLSKNWTTFVKHEAQKILSPNP